MSKPLIDGHNRVIDYLRISVNHECNYRCIYCDKEGYKTAGGSPALSPGDVESVVRLFNEIGGIKKVKITGGEPLIHPGIIEIIKRIASIPTIEDVSMTTNGYLLKRMAKDLREAGLNRVNVGLCSLNPETFKQVTGIDGLARVLDGIDDAITQGLGPIKINFVLLKGMNEGELNDVLEFCKEKGVGLQLIELHEIDGIQPEDCHFIENHYVDAEIALESITIPVDRIEYRGMQHRKLIFYENGAMIEMIKMQPDFCKRCSKLRITADGFIKPCLMRADEKVDLLKLIKEGKPRDILKLAIEKALMMRKPYMVES